MKEATSSKSIDTVGSYGCSRPVKLNRFYNGIESFCVEVQVGGEEAELPHLSVVLSTRTVFKSKTR